MPEQHQAQTIGSFSDFDKYLPGYLNANKTLAVLFDYDGTLAAIASNPNDTFMTEEIDSMLHKLAKQPNIFLAIISGRGLKDVQKKVSVSGITYAGNHGLEIEHPDGTRHDYQLPKDMQAKYKQLVEQLNSELAKNNAVVEDKRVSLTYHYRHTPEPMKEMQRRRAIEIIKAHGFRPNQAHESIEAKPPVDWNKGEAARYILKTKFGENWPQQISVVFTGDDTTDEDAMRLLQGYGKTFRIATDPEIQTYADFRLPRQDLVKDLLNWIGSTYAP